MGGAQESFLLKPQSPVGFQSRQNVLQQHVLFGQRSVSTVGPLVNCVLCELSVRWGWDRGAFMVRAAQMQGLGVGP